MQIDQGNKFADLGKQNFLRTEVLSPQRGNLIDCNGILLASNRPVFDLYWDGGGRHQFSAEQDEILQKVECILNLDLTKDHKLNNIKYAERHSKRILVKSDITFDQLCQISEQCSDFSNLVITNRFKRIYPYQNLASHVLGYLSRQEEEYTTHGLSGLEKIAQDQLKGEVGHVLNIINSRGRKLEQTEIKGAKAGNDIKLTLDAQLQFIAENSFDQDQSGAFIVMDPQDGAIKVLLSFPNFDPNIFLKPISQENWIDQLSINNPLLNRVTSALYPPASLFKLITFAAGLEEGVIDCDAQFKCAGFTKFYGRKYHCIRRWGHGEVDSKIALAYSCNIPCYQIAQRIKINQLADYAYRFGLGRPTGFLLYENSGLVPTYEWKVAVKNEPWWPGETLSASIGQSFTLVTPLQMIKMICSICTGYLVKPRILDREELQSERLEISDETLVFLREAMRGVATFGSAKIFNRLVDFKIYAKTGTAQTTSLEKEKVNKSQLEHAWLGCFFSYKEQSPLAIVVLVENVGSSAPARKIAAKFLQEYGKLMDKK